MDARELKVYLQSQGLRVEASVQARLGGAGPSEGITLFFEEKVATVPVQAPFAVKSPWVLEEEDGSFFLSRNGKFLCWAELPQTPRYYQEKTAQGIEMYKIAVRHGRDALGSTVWQACHHSPRCSFCAIDESLRRGLTILEKDPRQLEEVARLAKAEGFQHAVLTTGTPADADCGIGRLRDCALAMKNQGLPVHVQFEPPEDMESLEALSGVVDTVGIHIETFDQRVRERMAPGKCSRSLEDYVRAWSRAVEIFGPGRVSSFIIAGMGEDDQSILHGVKLLFSLGVFPFLLPLRPIPGTPLGDSFPPSPGRMLKLYEETARLREAEGFEENVQMAGCVRCGACSAVTDFAS